MPDIPDVVTNEEITVDWGNLIRDRVPGFYADETERASLHSSPQDGDESFLEDTGEFDFYWNGAWRHKVGVPVGTIIDHAGGAVPHGYLVCNGSAVSRTVYAALFAQIGETWGVGDGSTTFNLPDLRGRYARGVAASGTGDEVGDTFGADTHAHTGPSHTHSNPNTSSDNHSHSMSDTTTTAPNHDHAEATPNSLAAVGAGSATNVAASNHTHDITPAGTHNHTFSGTTGSDSHAHSQGSTGAGGTGATGSASTLPASVAVNKLIRR